MGVAEEPRRGRPVRALADLPDGIADDPAARDREMRETLLLSKLRTAIVSPEDRAGVAEAFRSRLDLLADLADPTTAEHSTALIAEKEEET